MASLAKLIIDEVVVDKPIRKAKTKYNKVDIIEELKFHGITRTVQLMGKASLVMQGHLRTCSRISALPLDDLSFMKKGIWDNRLKCYMLDNIELGDMRPRPDITTGIDGIKCQIRESYLSDCKINNIEP